jgi:hypothetical protein
VKACGGGIGTQPQTPGAIPQAMRLPRCFVTIQVLLVAFDDTTLDGC